VSAAAAAVPFLLLSGAYIVFFPGYCFYPVLLWFFYATSVPMVLLLSFLSCCCPVAGLMLYASFKGDKLHLGV
jgi:hypothetical protein